MNKQFIDVFNGDADGLCALIQLRLANPKESELVTGIKRDINLLKRVSLGTNTHITVLDISFEKNAQDVKRLLAQGAVIDYIDHHKTGGILKTESLNLDIDLSAETCTSLIVDKKLLGRYRAWAITGAFGDNISAVAKRLSVQEGLNKVDMELLQKLGTYLNYNGYGESVDDLLFHPAALYERLCQFESPLDFIKYDVATFRMLEERYSQDISKAMQSVFKSESDKVAFIELPNEKWARRISGVYGNMLANLYQDRAHAILTDTGNESYVVSIRAPLNNKSGADVVASQFQTGGGRKAAAGINELDKNLYDDFVAKMIAQYN